MNLNIKLDRERLVKTTDEPFLIAKNETLTLNFTSRYDLTNAVVKIKNGTEKETFKFSKTLAVPKSFIFAGKLNIQVELYVGGDKAKVWDILPLKIIETDQEIQCFDYLDNIDKRLTALEKLHEIIM